jgi:prolipoprotein diacylglyceryl transferase
MNMVSYIIWSANPEIFPSVDWLEIRWYGLLFALGFIISQQIMVHIFKVENKPLKDIDSLLLWMIIATILGARLGHVLFYEPLRYLKDPVSILKTWEGGLASHGAAIGILTGIWLYSNYLVDINIFKGKFVWKKRKRPGQSFLWVVDRIVICVALTGALIRFGNFLNAEIIGLPTQSSYGVVFARDIIDRLEYMPQIEEVAVEKPENDQVTPEGYVPIDINISFSRSVTDSNIAERILNTQVKSVLGGYQYVTMHVHQPTEEPLDYELREKSGGRVSAVISTQGIARHPAQLYESISTFLLMVLLLVVWNTFKAKTPEGLLFGIFLIVLFSLRFLYEFLKENQVQFEENIPLNMGQWLSIPLILAGIYILINLKKLQPKL